MTDYWYLATPYTSYPYGRNEAYHEACRAVAHCNKVGLEVFSPIVHSHPIEVLCTQDHAYWMARDKPFMDHAHGLIIVKMKGWEESKGIAAERELFKDRGLTIRLMDWKRNIEFYIRFNQHDP